MAAEVLWGPREHARGGSGQSSQMRGELRASPQEHQQARQRILCRHLENPGKGANQGASLVFWTPGSSLLPSQVPLMGSCPQSHASLGAGSTFSLMPWTRQDLPGLLEHTHSTEGSSVAEEDEHREQPNLRGRCHPLIPTKGKSTQVGVKCMALAPPAVQALNCQSLLNTPGVAGGSPSQPPGGGGSRPPGTGRAPWRGPGHSESQKEQWGAPRGMLVTTREAPGAAGQVGLALMGQPI